MPKKSRSSLEQIQNFVKNTYSHFGNLLLINDEKEYGEKHTELGYCYKYSENGSTIYKIECSKIGREYTDFRILMHEFGHIYLGHLDGIHEELDSQICAIFRDHRDELEDQLNKSLGIDFAGKLIERVIDDPVLNHSLHNIAMDMEVNSKILSKEDIEEMEADITSVLPKYEEELLKYIADNTEDEDKKKEIQDTLNKMANQAKIKLILPCRYSIGKDAQDQDIPFPDCLTYPEYLILIVKHLDQFVKMLVSIQMGGNGDASQITMQDIQNMLNKNWANKSDEYKKGYQDALNDYKNNQLGKKQNSPNQNGQQHSPEYQQGFKDGITGQNPNPTQQGNNGGQQPGDSYQDGYNAGQDAKNNQGQQGNQPGNQQGQGQGNDYDQGYQDALNEIANQLNGRAGQGMQSLSDLMNQMGMGQSNDPKWDGSYGNSHKGQRAPDVSDAIKDHRTDSRDEADRKRKVGQIKAGGQPGCGNSGGPDMLRTVNKEVDTIEMALNEVIRNMRTRVVKYNTAKDNLKLYNRGVVRSVIAPTVTRKVTIANEQKIVYLIDVSGSMDTELIDRILKTIGKSMKRLSLGLRYDIITWSTHLGEHIRDINPRKGVPEISSGGGTRIAYGIEYFKKNYSPEATLVIISDFEDYLEEWHEIEKTMTNYNMYGFNYGRGRYRRSKDIDWTNLKVRDFNKE